VIAQADGGGGGRPDTSNRFAVRSPNGGRTLYFDTNTLSPILVKLTRDEAANLAVWLFTLANVTTEERLRTEKEITR
jgi:hypothetical protein